MKQKLVVALLFLALRSFGQQEGLKELATQYLKQYYSLNFSALPEYYTEKTTWFDPTTSIFNPNNKPVVGGQNIIQNIKSSTNGVANMRYEISESFTSANNVVFIGWMSYDLTMQGKVIPIRLRAITALTIENKKILSHTDYADFDTFVKLLSPKQ